MGYGVGTGAHASSSLGHTALWDPQEVRLSLGNIILSYSRLHYLGNKIPVAMVMKQVAMVIKHVAMVMKTGCYGNENRLLW